MVVWDFSHQQYHAGNLAPAWCFSWVNPCRHKNNWPSYVSSRSLPIHCNRTSAKASKRAFIFLDLWICWVGNGWEMYRYLISQRQIKIRNKNGGIWDSFFVFFWVLSSSIFAVKRAQNLRSQFTTCKNLSVEMMDDAKTLVLYGVVFWTNNQHHQFP